MFDTPHREIPRDGTGKDGKIFFKRGIEELQLSFHFHCAWLPLFTTRMD